MEQLEIDHRTKVLLERAVRGPREQRYKCVADINRYGLRSRPQLIEIYESVSSDPNSPYGFDHGYFCYGLFTAALRAEAFQGLVAASMNPDISLMSIIMLINDFYISERPNVSVRRWLEIKEKKFKDMIESDVAAIRMKEKSQKIYQVFEDLFGDLSFEPYGALSSFFLTPVIYEDVECGIILKAILFQHFSALAGLEFDIILIDRGHSSYCKFNDGADFFIDMFTGVILCEQDVPSPDPPPDLNPWSKSAILNVLINSRWSLCGYTSKYNQKSRELRQSCDLGMSLIELLFVQPGLDKLTASRATKIAKKIAWDNPFDLTISLWLAELSLNKDSTMDFVQKCITPVIAPSPKPLQGLEEFQIGQVVEMRSSWGIFSGWRSTALSPRFKVFKFNEIYEESQSTIIGCITGLSDRIDEQFLSDGYAIGKYFSGFDKQKEIFIPCHDMILEWEL